MIKRNNDIRKAANTMFAPFAQRRDTMSRNRGKQARVDAGVYLYEIAEKLGVSEPTFNRWLRKELSDGWRKKALAAVEQLKREHEAEQENSAEQIITDEG